MSDDIGVQEEKLVVPDSRPFSSSSTPLTPFTSDLHGNSPLYPWAMIAELRGLQFLHEKYQTQWSNVGIISALMLTFSAPSMINPSGEVISTDNIALRKAYYYSGVASVTCCMFVMIGSFVLLDAAGDNAVDPELLYQFFRMYEKASVRITQMYSLGCFSTLLNGALGTFFWMDFENDYTAYFGIVLIFIGTVLFLGFFAHSLNSRNKALVKRYTKLRTEYASSLPPLPISALSSDQFGPLIQSSPDDSQFGSPRSNKQIRSGMFPSVTHSSDNS
eukprot:gb/GEZN01010371.1/.p1 GENE.gb/GEZN01010371.1/~~gb/GEZN01010371.1/.p1  ORF type:complete len:275 (+),score=32.69 gb/GEZN01010371.1/:188-1012(+)